MSIYCEDPDAPPGENRASGVTTFNFICAHCQKPTTRIVASPGGAPRYCLACVDVVKAQRSKERLKQWRATQTPHPGGYGGIDDGD